MIFNVIIFQRYQQIMENQEDGGNFYSKKVSGLALRVKTQSDSRSQTPRTPRTPRQEEEETKVGLQNMQSYPNYISCFAHFFYALIAALPVLSQQSMNIKQVLRSINSL